MVDTFTPPVAPSYSSSVKTVNRTLVANLGDGYSVRAGDGLNSRQRIWNVRWDVLDLTDANTIETFLNTQEGYKAFIWTPPRGAIGKWICKEFDREPQGPSHDSISASFEEVFDL